MKALILHWSEYHLILTDLKVQQIVNGFLTIEHFLLLIIIHQYNTFYF